MAGTNRSAGGIWGTSPDYYKNLTEEDFRKHWDVDSLFKDYEFVYDSVACDLYFKGVKK